MYPGVSIYLLHSGGRDTPYSIVSDRTLQNILIDQMVRNIQFRMVRLGHQPVPYRIFHKRLNEHRRNLDFIWIDGVINLDPVRKEPIKTKLFRQENEFEHFHFLLQEYEVVIAVVQNLPLQPRKFGQIFIGLDPQPQQDILLDRSEGIENK